LGDREESRIREQAFRVEFQGRLSLLKEIHRHVSAVIVIVLTRENTGILYSDAVCNVSLKFGVKINCTVFGLQKG
jgi:hypothetical protein